MVVFHRHIHVAPAHIVDTVLWEVAIDNCDVVSLDIVQVTCNQHRDGRFSGSSFLRGESYIDWFVHTVVHFNRYTLSYLFLHTSVPTVSQTYRRRCGRIYLLTAQRSNNPTLVGCDVGQAVTTVHPTCVCRTDCPAVRRSVLHNLLLSRPTALRWFVWQINKEKTALVRLRAQVAACGVRLAAFGVFGLGKAAPEASTFAPKRQGAPRAYSCGV